MHFSEIDTSNVRPTDFGQVQDLLDSGQPGQYNIDARKAYTTSGDTFWFLGNITLRLQGVLTINNADSWSFGGTLKSFDDTYDFNASTHRSLLGELMTTFGRNTPGKVYDIDIRGAKPITQHGN